ncbi:mandelate racemase/muconate lactonizing enzyme family protein [Nocardia brevicatena]|uniref:mandelate racemase/muconate lactonizing enzyme family protein n=1 Tax=Nocardia brevicatena TaxID=37327 RepID=UPI000592E130|nr:mandelate racemase/muconate lactonizing enzyme family protein [Nocardia brevicatena]
MRVADVDAFVLRAALERPIWDARSRIEHRAAVLVRVVTTDPEIVGWGEAACFGGAERAVAAAVEGASELIRGRDIEPRVFIDDTHQRLAHWGRAGIVTSAISGIEIALWDALGKAAGMPVSRLFGVKPRALPVYRTLGFYPSVSEDDSLPSLRSALAEHDLSDLSAVKIKIGRHGRPDDLGRAQTAREIIGNDIGLIVDANNAYTLRDALAVCRALDELDVLFLEEPIEFDQPEASARLRAESPVPIAGYELAPTAAGCQRYLDAGAVDYLQPDAIWSGGIAEGVRIAEAASLAGVRVIPHNFSTSVGTAANYHLATIANSPLLEIDGTGSPIGDKALAWDGWSTADGALAMVDGVGLGVPDPESWMGPFIDE